MLTVGVEPAIVFAAIFGSVAYLAHDTKLTPRQGVMCVMSSAPLSVYLTRPVFEVAKINAPLEYVSFLSTADWQNGLAFILAFIGVPLGSALLSLVSAAKDKVILRWFRKER